MTTATIPRDDLPLWMQRALRGTDWGVLVVLALCLLASLPFVNLNAVPIGTAFERYVFRAADVAQSLREGQLYPRWTDEAIGGYGAPIPNFTPPAAAYLPALLDVTLINDPAVSVALTFVAALCLAGTATYAFVARQRGAAAGLTAAVLYIFNPFIGYTIPQQLGDLSLALGAAFLPILLWSIDRVLSQRGLADVGLAALCYAALWFTEPKFAIVGSALVIVLIISHRPYRNLAVWQTFLAMLFGAGLAACYWLPAVLEAQYVVWYPAETSALHLINWRTLFSIPGVPDPAALLNPPSLNLGPMIPLYVVLAMWMMLRRQKYTLALWGICLAGSGLIILALSNPSQIWLLTPTALCLAIVGSAALEMREIVSSRFSRLIPVAILSLAIGSVLPLWLTGAREPEAQPISDFSSASQVSFEQRGYGVAVLSPGEPLPSTISPNLPQDARLLRGYLTGTSRRFVQTGSAQIGIISDEAHEIHLQVQVLSDTSLRILSAAFPGWMAQLSGRTIPFSSAAPSDGTLPQLNLAQGERGELVISLEPTVPRVAGWALTWIALAGIVLVSFTRRRQFAANTTPMQVELLSPPETRLFAVLLAGVGILMLVRFAMPEVANLAGWQPIPGIGLANAQMYNIRSDAGLELIAYDMDTSQKQPGSTIDLTLYWRSLRQLTENYRVQLALRDRSTQRVDTVTLIQHPGGLPTSRWSPRRYMQDSWQVAIPSTLSAGEYDLLVAVFTCSTSCQTRESVNFFDEPGVPLGQVVTLPVPVQIIS